MIDIGLAQVVVSGGPFWFYVCVWPRDRPWIAEITLGLRQGFLGGSIGLGLFGFFIRYGLDFWASILDDLIDYSWKLEVRGREGTIYQWHDTLYMRTPIFRALLLAAAVALITFAIRRQVG